MGTMLQRVNVEVVLRRERLQMKYRGVAAFWCFANAPSGFRPGVIDDGMIVNLSI
jgi:hypothetical protein